MSSVRSRSTRLRRLITILHIAVFEENWNLNMRSRLTDKEIEEAARLLHLLQNVHLSEDEDELLWWTEGKQFTVRGCSTIISNARVEVLQLKVLNFPKSRIWKGCMPARANFFLWLWFRERVLTDDRLKEMGTNLPSICSFCEEEEETREHLFLHCKIANYALTELLNGSCSNHNQLMTIEEYINGLECRNLTTVGQIYWSMLQHAFFWGVWLARKLCRFEGDQIQGWRLVQKIKTMLWNWGLGDKRLEEVKIEELMFSWNNIMYQ